MSCTFSFCRSHPVGERLQRDTEQMMREVYSRQKAAEHAVQWTKEGLCVVLDSATRSAVQNMSGEEKQEAWFK